MILFGFKLAVTGVIFLAVSVVVGSSTTENRRVNLAAVWALLASAALLVVGLLISVWSS